MEDSFVPLAMPVRNYSDGRRSHNTSSEVQPFKLGMIQFAPPFFCSWRFQLSEKLVINAAGEQETLDLALSSCCVCVWGCSC